MQIDLGLVVILSLLNAVISLPAEKYKRRSNAVSFFSTSSTAAAENQFPHHVAFLNIVDGNSLFLCSGAIVDENHVVTTASAVGYSPNVTFNASNFNLFAGSTDVLGGITKAIHIVNLTAHPNYTSNSNENDIIVFQVTPTFNFSDAVKPITISTNFTLDTSQDCAISTFADPAGQSDEGVSDHLEWSNISRITCPEVLQPSDSLFCAGNNTSQTTILTTMDKGSPMVCNSKLVGLVTSSQHGYLTNITKYYDFIFPPPVTPKPDDPQTEHPTTERTPNTVSDSIFDNTFVRIIVIITAGFIIAIASFALVVKIFFLIFKK